MADQQTFMPARIAVKLNKTGQRSIKQGHPWVFDQAIEKISEGARSGDLAIIFDNHTDKLLGVGYIDMGSPIRIKMLGLGAIQINSDFFKSRLKDAYQLRKPLLKTQTNAYRLVFGENDGFPGLIVDIYNRVVVVKLYSAIWFQHLGWLPEYLCELTKANTVVLRLSRNLQKTAAHYKEGQLLFGSLTDSRVAFLEHGLKFFADVLKGHKTGYFLDHRHNRKMVGSLALGKRVLDVFAYAGGFSVHALAGGAQSVTSVDLSSQALEVARQNAAANPHKGAHICLQGDAFELLDKLNGDGQHFDIVVVDPPAFAKQQADISKAKNAYRRLVNLAAPLVSTGGMLVMASCSSRISAASFFNLVAQTLKESGYSYELWKQTAHDLDHPIGFAEGAYLKCGYYKFQ